MTDDFSPNLIQTVIDITEMLTEYEDTDTLLDKILDLLKRQGLSWTALKITDPASEDIIIKYSSGLSPEEIERGRYKIGEGITGTVFQEAHEIVIRDITKDDRFLNKLMNKSAGGSFFCFPISSGERVVGALSAFTPEISDAAFNSYMQLFRLVTPLINQSIRIVSKIESDQLKLKEENFKLRSELSGKKGLANFVGNSSKMLEVYEQIRMVANSNATVLILGSNGTGKELVADAIHYSSMRANKPLVKINSAALPDNLIESELFGHEKGAFTGASHTKKGRIEMAEGGTLFLDEIGELSLNLQAKLLRFLQNREFERVGSVITMKSNVRIIAATNRDLQKEVEKGSFREDLFYRLNVFPIYLPRLAERKTDITLLADHFLQKYAKENMKPIKRISTPAIDMLLSYHWPGNVRELENCIERAVLVCQGDTIRAQDMPPSLQTSETVTTQQANLYENWTLPQAVANLEKEMIVEALKRHGGHQGKAARSIGITERQIGYKMKLYRISKSIVHG